MTIKKQYKLTGIVIGCLMAQNALAGSATLTWNANTEPDLAGYRIYYGTTSHAGNCPAGFAGSRVSVGNTTTHTFNDLTEGQTYYFQVTAMDTASNESVCSAEVSKTIATVDATAPITSASPAGGAFTVAQSVVLTSNEAATIYYTTDGSAPSVTSAVYGAPIAVATSTTIKYFAKDGAGNSEAIKTQAYTINIATPDTVAPSVPGGVSAAAQSSSQVNIAWNASTDARGVVGYKVYRHDVQIATTAGTSYADTGLVAGTAYRYRVAAYDASGNVSALSTEATATTQVVASTESPSSSGAATATNTGSSVSAGVVAQSATTTQQAVAQQQPTSVVATPAQTQQSTTATQTVRAEYKQFGSYVTKKHLAYRAKGEDVKRLQEFLKVDGYLKDTPTGYYGKATLAAVQAFQREHGIASAGKEGYGEVGLKTRAIINQHLTGSATPTLAASTQDALRQQIVLLQAKVLELLKQIEAMKR